MKIRIKQQRVGMNMQEATIAEWHKQPGDTFAEGDILYSFETDKVVQEVTATAPGKLLEIYAVAGDDVEVGAEVCMVDLQT